MCLVGTGFQLTPALESPLGKAWYFSSSDPKSRLLRPSHVLTNGQVLIAGAELPRAAEAFPNSVNLRKCFVPPNNVPKLFCLTRKCSFTAVVVGLRSALHHACAWPEGLQALLDARRPGMDGEGLDLGLGCFDKNETILLALLSSFCVLRHGRATQRSTTKLLRIGGSRDAMVMRRGNLSRVQGYHLDVLYHHSIL